MCRALPTILKTFLSLSNPNRSDLLSLSLPQIPATMKGISTAEDFPLPPQHPRPHPPTQRKKKTRELPNLSNCHCCNRRINCTNPKNRLRTLTSEWRIVLLCNSCYNLVESCQFCSYCLSGLSPSTADSLFECKQCHRRIHRTCLSMFSFGPGNGGDFSVCFDCWVPKLLENDYSRICESRPRKKARKEAKICGDSTSLESSRVCDSQDRDESLEEMVNEANFVAQKKFAVAVEAKDKAVAKAVVARKAVELASGVLNFVSADRGGGNRGGSVVNDDTQLAIQLHRAMNSSPRISRNSCLLNASHVNVSVVNVNANLEGWQSQTVDKMCFSMAFNVGSDANTVDIDSFSRREQSGLCSVDARKDFAQKTEETDGQKRNIPSDSNDCLITYSRKRRASQDGRSKEPDGLLRMYRRRLSHVERRNAERNHCFRTYHRRLSTMSHCKNMVNGGFNLERGILAPTFALNSCENPRVFADAS